MILLQLLHAAQAAHSIAFGLREGAAQEQHFKKAGSQSHQKLRAVTRTGTASLPLLSVGQTMSHNQPMFTKMKMQSPSLGEGVANSAGSPGLWLTNHLPCGRLLQVSESPFTPGWPL